MFIHFGYQLLNGPATIVHHILKQARVCSNCGGINQSDVENIRFYRCSHTFPWIFLAQIAYRNS